MELSFSWVWTTLEGCLPGASGECLCHPRREILQMLWGETELGMFWGTERQNGWGTDGKERMVGDGVREEGRDQMMGGHEGHSRELGDFANSSGKSLPLWASPFPGTFFVRTPSSILSHLGYEQVWMGIQRLWASLDSAFVICASCTHLWACFYCDSWWNRTSLRRMERFNLSSFLFSIGSACLDSCVEKDCEASPRLRGRVPWSISNVCPG